MRVDTQGEALPSLELAESDSIAQGAAVVAFGNPLGLEYSVVQGIVSAIREVEGQRLIQLAMPIEPGNSGGPLIDFERKLHGIVNMKSAIDDNLGFAIPVGALRLLQTHPNPILAERWIQIGVSMRNAGQPCLARNGLNAAEYSKSKVLATALVADRFVCRPWKFPMETSIFM